MRYCSILDASGKLRHFTVFKISFKMSHFWYKISNWQNKMFVIFIIFFYNFADVFFRWISIFGEMQMFNLPFSSSSSEELEDVSVEKSESAKGKKGNESQGKFCKDSLTILLSLWCRMISTPNSGKGTEFFLSTRSEFNSAKMQSTECMEGAEEIQGPDLVTLRLELVTFSFSYSSVISSISSSICE